MARVLVLDDDEDFRSYLVTLLKRAGHEAIGLPDGSHLKNALESGVVDVIVTDLYMPNVDGIETAEFVTRHAPTIPLIGISGSAIGARDPCVEAMKLFGARAVLAKPLDPAAFLSELQNALSSVEAVRKDGDTTSS